ncbi:helix-turn-helix domain-containing protein [Streptomyces triticirhizae]|uniref:Helix-turn-helix domain-containing protein n=1 Tax=Streptomyces triticirhizae TaxID=2483353 RepID=A0A3M2LR18_9ACTN|nr:helix-turn-helix domain-containing protein [Streptomyces triticirhizae]
MEPGHLDKRIRGRDVCCLARSGRTRFESGQVRLVTASRLPDFQGEPHELPARRRGEATPPAYLPRRAGAGGGALSIEAMLWAMHDSPAADTTERLILVALGDKANADGTDAFPSKATLARVALCDEKTVQRKIRALKARGVVALGDQAAARYIPSHVRPKVYDLLIPASWYGPERLARVNAERQQKGLPPLSAATRPPIASPPTKRSRSDKGKPRKAFVEPAFVEPEEMLPEPPSEGGDSQSPPPRSEGGGLSVPPGGDSQSPGGGLSVPQPIPINPPVTRPPSVRPSTGTGRRARTDGRTDGRDVDAAGKAQRSPVAATAGAVPPASTVARTPGVELLLDIGQQHPEFAIWGQPLADQGRIVTGLLAEGWTRAQIRRVITGRPLPEQIRTSVGAIISRRLLDAAMVPPPAGRRPVVPPQLPAAEPEPVPEPEPAPTSDLPAETIPCPGWDGTPCGADSRSVDEDGLCGPCRFRVIRRQEKAKKSRLPQGASR